ncbi:SHOCT domain-containing protein [Halobaculum gomorrense]|uniref:Short C-terminal domain-containing protein n=1 Tax=Halobaculum gomorrense TaxID=43928 RepID=A0A1M5JEY4_9EURY|nr:SHOCT domain-containing protein [Halobaculum gomorrense]SHG38830.1 Short C-terminal domain-containing protein [Halobaculum gomorrense]
MSASPAQRLRENLTGVVSTAVTGIWLAAMFTGQDWWLAALLFGYVVVVPVTAMLFGDEDDVEEWWDGADEHAEQSRAGPEDEDTTDALDTLRDRYARGDLTDEQFERKLERLLESESLEDVADRAARERRAADHEHDSREAERE